MMSDSFKTLGVSILVLLAVVATPSLALAGWSGGEAGGWTGGGFGAADERDSAVEAMLAHARQSRDEARRAAYWETAQAAAALVAEQSTYQRLMNLGEAQLGSGAFDAAEGTLTQAAAMNPGAWLAHSYLVQARASAGRYDRAEEAFRAALSCPDLAGNQSFVWGQLGFVFERVRNYSAARDAYQRAGDAAAVARVEANERIFLENQQVERENAEIKGMEQERERLEQELKNLEGGGR